MSVLRESSKVQHCSSLQIRACTGNLQDGLSGPWQLKRGYTQVFGYTRALSSPTGATHRYAQASGSPLGALYSRLEPQPQLRKRVRIPNQGYTQALESSIRATHGCLEPQTGDPASCQACLYPGSARISLASQTDLGQVPAFSMELLSHWTSGRGSFPPLHERILRVLGRSSDHPHSDQPQTWPIPHNLASQVRSGQVQIMVQERHSPV